MSRGAKNDKKPEFCVMEASSERGRRNIHGLVYIYLRTALGEAMSALFSGGKGICGDAFLYGKAEWQ